MLKRRDFIIVSFFSCEKHCSSRRLLIAIFPDIDRLVSSVRGNRTEKIDENGSWMRTRYSWPLSVFTVGGLGLELGTHLLLKGRKWRVKVLGQVFACPPGSVHIDQISNPCKNYSQGILNHTGTDIFNVLIPQSLIFGMVRNDAYNGHLAHNPINFQLFDLQGGSSRCERRRNALFGFRPDRWHKIDGYNTLRSY